MSIPVASTTAFLIPISSSSKKNIRVSAPLQRSFSDAEVVKPFDASRKSNMNRPIIPLENSRPLLENMNMTKTKTTVMSAAGTVFTVSVLYTLAMSGEDASLLFGGGGGPAASLTSLEVAGYNIVDAALPLRASDIVSVAVGEAIAGVIGAAASFEITRTMMQFQMTGGSPSPTTTQAKTAETTTTGSVFTNNINSNYVAGGSGSRSGGGVKVSDAVADGDLLLTSAAAKQLLEAFGLPPLVASLTATAVAIIPYSFVKVGARKRERERQEEELMEQLLEEEQDRERRTRIRFGIVTDLKYSNAAAGIVDPKSLSPVQDERPKLDWVETFADIVKWLQFDILHSDFGGHLEWQGQALFPGVESAIFGGVTALTSQIYADALYAYFGFGGERMQAMVRARTPPEWAALYLPKIIYCAVLFGVYDALQIPAQSIVAALGSGGVDACLGSDDYRSCIDTYVKSNPTGASPEAELRSLVIATVSFWNNHGVPSWSLS